MAVGGSATSAYSITVVNGQLSVVPTTAMSNLCVKPVAALPIIKQGQRVVIAGSDMAEFWRLWNTTGTVE